MKTLQRTALLLVLSFTFTACELIGDIFQAGFVVGIIIVLVILGVIAWVVRMFRGRSGPPR